MTPYQRYLALLTLLENTILVIGLPLMLGITFMNIIGRKFLHTSWAFTEEITCSMFLLVTLVGAAVAARRGAHLGLSILTDLFPRSMQKTVIIFSGLCGVAFCLLLTYVGIEMVLGEIETDMRTPALGWPEWIFGAFVPLGGFIMALEFINYPILTLEALRLKKED